MSSGLVIDTSVQIHYLNSGPRSARLASAKRSRALSNASTSSSLSIISPTFSSTNSSASSLLLPRSISPTSHRSKSPSSPTLDETVKLGSEYVLAMHDFEPNSQNATCLSFKAGQVIRVLNRDSSGWWDGELEGRRGWFPSNYVNAEFGSLTDEAPLDVPRRNGHSYSASIASTASWSTASSSSDPNRGWSIPDDLGSELDQFCSPLMVPLLHGLSLLQNAVKSGKIVHSQPSTAFIISSVRSILSSTNCLPREAPILQRCPVLFHERKAILTILASLVAQAKKVTESAPDDDDIESEIDSMLKLGGQVFTHARRFLVAASECGIKLPEVQDPVIPAAEIQEETDEKAWADNDVSSSSVTPRRPPATRSKTLPDFQTNRSISGESGRSSVPLSLNGGSFGSLSRRKGLKAHKLSVSSNGSFSSSSSVESFKTPLIPPFPHGASSASQVTEALRHTHDHFLSTIAAFIGSAHSHTRASHASSTGHMYDLVREIVDMVCKLLTIVDAVMRHPDVPSHKLADLKMAKDSLFNVTGSLAESVRLLTLPLTTDVSEEEEKQRLLRSATGALKAGADCVGAVKMCVNRNIGERPFVIKLPAIGEGEQDAFASNRFTTSALLEVGSRQFEDDDLTVHAPPLSNGLDSETLEELEESSHEDTVVLTDMENGDKTPVDEGVEEQFAERNTPSPSESFARTDEDGGTTWEGSLKAGSMKSVESGSSQAIDRQPPPPSPTTWMVSHDYTHEDVAYNSEGLLVGATLPVLVAKMTPHDSIVDQAFSAVFFMTFRLFSSPAELVEVIIDRYNIRPPENLLPEDTKMWQDLKGVPVRLRVSNFIKLWLETYWRSMTDDGVLSALKTFTLGGLASMFPGPAQRILELIELREGSVEITVYPRGDRTRDPGMSINPPTVVPASEIPRPLMTKTLLAALRSKSFATIAITDFDPLELARQLTIMEYRLYCAIQPEEILETGQEGARPPVNVKAVTALSTVITGWVAESILDEFDTKKRTALVKFFIKLADRCASLQNYSTPRSILAALDSSTISRLHLTWSGLPQKNRSQLEILRRLSDHSRNYYEYRTKLRNTGPPAVPFLGLYLTDVTFCREGNPSHRASPLAPSKKLINFNKFHKLARIVQDMQRFQTQYNLKAIPEVQAFLDGAFEKARHHGDLQDLYRRSLLVEPKQPADNPPASDMRQLFSWASRTPQTITS